jgi:D-lactate dehydrogenase (cytochrome)
VKRRDPVDLQRAVDQEGLLYPPIRRARCFVGGTSHQRLRRAHFQVWPNTQLHQRLKVVLASGEVLDLRAAKCTLMQWKNSSRQSSSCSCRLSLPRHAKERERYFVAPEMDAIDLFIGSEGTLGVICEDRSEVVAKAEGLLSGVVFFATKRTCWRLCSECGARRCARARVFRSRVAEFPAREVSDDTVEAVGAIFFEQETTERTKKRAEPVA